MHSGKLLFQRSAICFIFILFLIGCNCDVCYNGIGCFSQDYPWTSLTRPFPAPASPEQINVTLIFFSRNQNGGQALSIYPNINFNVNDFNPLRTTVTITHGFLNSADVDWVKKTKDKYLENVDANVFLVDWKQGASGINYLQCASNTRVVGAVVGRFAMYLVNTLGVPIKNFHLIGHSLGAHISGYIAKYMNNVSSSGGKPSRITGLDPAQPGFQNEPTNVRLNKGDADFIDIVHSDAKPFFPLLGLGYLTPLGDVDFYLNKGSFQPNCVDVTPFGNMTSIMQLGSVAANVLFTTAACSHGRSCEVFISSIDPGVKCEFIGHSLITPAMFPVAANQFSCDMNGGSCIKMGLDTPKYAARGSFQVVTSGVSPFCCYNYNLLSGCQKLSIFPFGK